MKFEQLLCGSYFTLRPLNSYDKNVYVTTLRKKLSSTSYERYDKGINYTSYVYPSFAIDPEKYDCVPYDINKILVGERL